MSEVRQEWQVVSFPPGERNKWREFKDEGAARRHFDGEVEAGALPILSVRTVEVSHWSVVENSAERRGNG